MIYYIDPSHSKGLSHSHNMVIRSTIAWQNDLEYQTTDTGFSS